MINRARLVSLLAVQDGDYKTPEVRADEILALELSPDPILAPDMGVWEGSERFGHQGIEAM